jgi:L-asparagine transporter-like permease
VEIFLTHLAFLRRHPGPGRRAASAAGLAAMVGIIVTTWWVPGLRVTLQSGIPWLMLLTLGWAWQRRKASAVSPSP